MIPSRVVPELLNSGINALDSRVESTGPKSRRDNLMKTKQEVAAPVVQNKCRQARKSIVLLFPELATLNSQLNRLNAPDMSAVSLKIFAARQALCRAEGYLQKAVLMLEKKGGH